MCTMCIINIIFLTFILVIFYFIFAESIAQSCSPYYFLDFLNETVDWPLILP